MPLAGSAMQSTKAKNCDQYRCVYAECMWICTYIYYIIITIIYNMVVDEQKRENNLQGSSFLAIDRIDSRFLIKCHLKTVKSTILWGKSNYVYFCRFHTLCATLDRNVIQSVWLMLGNLGMVLSFTCRQYISGWWFGTCFIFHNIWDNPSHWLILFKMVKTTNNRYYLFLIDAVCVCKREEEGEVWDRRIDRIGNAPKKTRLRKAELIKSTNWAPTFVWTTSNEKIWLTNWY